MEKKEAIRALLTAGASEIKNLRVKGVNITPKENYVLVTMSLDKKVPAFVDVDGTIERGEMACVSVSLFSIASVLRESDEIVPVVGHLIDNPKALGIVLSGATINVIQQDVVAGQVWTNPWNDSENEPLDHDAIINHVVDIKLSANGKVMVDKLTTAILLGQA